MFNIFRLIKYVLFGISFGVMSPAFSSEEAMPKNMILTTEGISLKGITVGMSEEKFSELFPQIVPVIQRPKEKTAIWRAGDSIGFLKDKDVSCIGVLQEKPCNKISLMDKVPVSFGVSFIDNKLAFVDISFRRQVGSVDLDQFYSELKDALSEKLKSQPEDERSEEYMAREFHAFTSSGWVNKVQNTSLTISDSYNVDDSPNVIKLTLKSLDFDSSFNTRHQLVIEERTRLEAEAAKAKSDKKKSDF